MRKKILIIGDTDTLEGVPVDIAGFYDFFTSPEGGNWRDDEIETLKNPTKREFFRELDKIEDDNLDYLITIFSGHGSELNDETVLCINREETIELSDLMDLCRKQLIIADCCRTNYMTIQVDLVSILLETTALSMSRNDPVREAYEQRIAESTPQQIILFACDEGETTKDTVDEEIQSFSQYLLEATQMILDEARSPFVRVSQSHARARKLIRENPKLKQRPRIIQPNLPIHQRLPFAVNPEFF